jgi:DNA-binding SARP family transcriptional activator
MEGEVRVLGPVEVTWANGDASPPDRASVLAAVVSYLGTHDDHPVPAERLQEAIWPLLDDDPSGDVRAGAVKDTTLRSTVSRARKALGKDSQGRHHLPAARVGAYQLGPRYKCDWTEFRRLVAAARTAPASEAIELYRQALDKVRGRPFEDAPAPWFTWADDSPLVSDIEVAVVRAAEELGERALEAGETELAAWAARQGLRVIPVREHLTRVRMQAAFNAGDADGIEQAHTEAVRAVRRFVDPAEPLQDETERLYQKLKRACRSGGQHQRQATEAGVR